MFVPRKQTRGAHDRGAWPWRRWCLPEDAAHAVGDLVCFHASAAHPAAPWL